MKREYFYFNPKGEVANLYVFSLPYGDFNYCYSTLTNVWFFYDGETFQSGVVPSDKVPVEHRAKLLLLL